VFNLYLKRFDILNKALIITQNREIRKSKKEDSLKNNSWLNELPSKFLLIDLMCVRDYWFDSKLLPVRYLWL